jgi:very-short-patch-repair endonuclease
MRVPRDSNRRLLGFARRMRKSSTDAERKLWKILRSRELAGFKFRRQHPIGGYILDFYCVQHKLAVESDGGQHSEPSATEYDAVRTRRLNELGVRVVRLWDNDILAHPVACADEILRCLEAKPSP